MKIWNGSVYGNVTDTDGCYELISSCLFYKSVHTEAPIYDI